MHQILLLEGARSISIGVMVKPEAGVDDLCAGVGGIGYGAKDAVEASFSRAVKDLDGQDVDINSSVSSYLVDDQLCNSCAMKILDIVPGI